MSIIRLFDTYIGTFDDYFCIQLVDRLSLEKTSPLSVLIVFESLPNPLLSSLTTYIIDKDVEDIFIWMVHYVPTTLRDKYEQKS